MEQGEPKDEKPMPEDTRQPPSSGGTDRADAVAGAPAAGGGAAVAGAPSAELAEALREKDQFKKLAQRVQADFINYRNRTEEEITQARRSGVRRLALRVIEVLDLFDAALSPQATPAVDANWVNGVRAIQKSLLAALGSEGIERLTIAGEKFDPRRHEALISTPTAEHEPGTVIRELRPGYAHQGEVVRPAQVEVATSPPDDAPAPESKPE